MPWAEPESALTTLLAAARECADAAERSAADWSLVWCAGAGVVATPAAHCEAEARLFAAFTRALPTLPATVFLASSAGGVFAGSSGAPFTESHPERPLAPYGHAKLAMEHAARAMAQRGSRIVLGRLANLYGPGQDLSKPQGLVSQLCLSRLTGKPLQIYVSSDTMRDYLYVGDAAATVVAVLHRIAERPDGEVVVKIIASGQSTTVSGLLSAATRAFRKRPPVVYGAVRASGQVLDLRLRSQVWTDLDQARTPLVVGLRATADEVSRAHREARLSIAG